MSDSHHLPDPQQPHNHAHCVSHALSAAEQVCARDGVRFTTLRKRVLELVWQSHKPLGAYDILETLSRDDGRRAAPPTVYRALDFLQEQGLVHRIASLNAFVGCADPSHRHSGHFLICRHCNTAIELDAEAIDSAIRQAAEGRGFHAEEQGVEVVGSCQRCQEQPESA